MLGRVLPDLTLKTANDTREVWILQLRIPGNHELISEWIIWQRPFDPLDFSPNRWLIATVLMWLLATVLIRDGVRCTGGDGQGWRRITPSVRYRVIAALCPRLKQDLFLLSSFVGRP